jgi:hypothetical protein
MMRRGALGDDATMTFSRPSWASLLETELATLRLVLFALSLTPRLTSGIVSRSSRR